MQHRLVPFLTRHRANPAKNREKSHVAAGLIINCLWTQAYRGCTARRGIQNSVFPTVKLIMPTYIGFAGLSTLSLLNGGSV